MSTALRHIKQKGLAWLFTCFAGLLCVSAIISCGKANTAIPVGANIQFQVVNLSPDLRPINLWVGFIKRNVAYSYPTPSGYFSMASVDTPLQIRSALATVSSANLVSIDTILRANTKYTLFVTGLRADTTITGIFTIDTSATSTPGRGKIRFINASPKSPGLDVMANGTTAFTNRAYKTVSKFIEIAPGSYDFKITPNGSPTNVLYTINRVSVQDGKLYTIYSHGMVGRTDTAAFGAGVIANK